MSVCELRFAFNTRSPSAVISNLDKSVMILLSMVLTPAPFSVTMSLMLPAEMLLRCETSIPNSTGEALASELTSPVI
ncbi:hypothetical protein BAZOLSSOX_355 [uncultured Gammaproteobacteria bacterium]|nr:hypothetical protein BAZOLSSOX_355 [uncultured Gammaproteobacteria bacterium]